MSHANRGGRMCPKSRPGQALVEFALVLPVLLALLTGIIDVGFLFHHQLLLTNAAREGARMGTLGQDASQVQGAVLAYLSQSGYAPLPVGSKINVDLTGDMASVTIDSDVPVIFSVSGPPVPLRATTRMRLE